MSTGKTLREQTLLDDRKAVATLLWDAFRLSQGKSGVFRKTFEKVGAPTQNLWLQCADAAMSYPRRIAIGDKYRSKDGLIWHVCGFVEGRIIYKCWERARSVRYTVLTEKEFLCSVYLDSAVRCWAGVKERQTRIQCLHLAGV